jgi:hypothetical protein
MKTLMLVIAAVMIGESLLSCRYASQLRANSDPAPGHVTQNVSQATPTASPQNWDDYRELLFVDQSLEEMVTRHGLTGDHFAKAYKHVKDGRPEEAKKSLRQILADPSAEVREKLLAWGALRKLGEKLPPNLSGEIVGVVLEVPVENWVDTLAAYSDGRARYLNGTGGVIVHEVAGDPRLDSLVKGVIEAAKPLVQKAPAFDKHRPQNSEVIRVSILTYEGIRMMEAKESDITGSHPMSPVFNAGTRLFLTLLEYSEKAKQDG